MKYERRSELDMMQTYQEWPLYPYLPVKRRKADGSWPDLGVIVAWDELKNKKPDNYVVYKVGLDEMLSQAKTKSWSCFKFLETAEKEIFPTLEAVIAAGWLVD